MLEQGRSVRSPHPEEEAVAETTFAELNTASILCPPEGRREGKGEKIGGKVEPGKEGSGEGVFKTWVYFSLSYSSLICNKFRSFPQIKPVLPVTVIADWPAEKGSDGDSLRSGPHNLKICSCSEIQIRTNNPSIHPDIRITTDSYI